MKLVLLALLSLAASAAFGQPAPVQVDPDQLFQMPPKFSAAQGFQPGAANLHALTVAPPHFTVMLPGKAAPGLKLNDPKLDPKSIVRPPWPRGDARQGQEVARDRFRNLRFLPLHMGTTNVRVWQEDTTRPDRP
ncbi:MAG TPA: hypothetical protein VGG85_08150 [Terracidiphilus sp.]|jgi:hypothetical protein